MSTLDRRKRLTVAITGWLILCNCFTTFPKAAQIGRPPMSTVGIPAMSVQPLSSPPSQEAEVSAGLRFRECSNCPVVTVIPAGHFTMTRKVARDGRKDDDPEGVPKTKPAREVVIESALAMGAYPVTRQEFSEFARENRRVAEKGCHVQQGGVWVLDESKDWRNPGFTQTDRDPVVCVSWYDAQDYVRWLNGRQRISASRGAMRGIYRMPSWEEIEYAAGGGTPSAYYWGEVAQRDKANYGAEQCLPCTPRREGEDRWLNTSPVGSFPPNPFGLYDMAGNVWQWAQSCQPDPSAIPPKECHQQVLHGGSWLTNPEYLQTGEYSSADPRHRNNHIGFRIVRTFN